MAVITGERVSRYNASVDDASLSRLVVGESALA